MKRILSILLCVVLWSASSVAQTRIALLCDLHISPGNRNEQMLKAVIEEINADPTQIVVVAGDVSNEGSDEELQRVKELLGAIKKPQFVIPGNHEDQWSQSACKRFNDLWGNDRFVTELDGMVIVGINCGPYMKAADGHIKREDLSWLDKTLAQHKEKRVISINHYPITVDDLDNYDQYINVLSKYRVAVHLCGHYHKFSHYKAGSIDALMNRSLMMNDNYGYTIIEVEGDTLRQWDKQLGKEPALVTEMKINDSPKQPIKRTLDSFDEPEQATVEMVHADEASVFTRMAVDEATLYFGNSLGEVKAIDKLSGELRWSLKTANSLFSQPSLAGRYLIVPTSDERLLWLDKKTGKVVRERKAKGPYAADGVVVNGILYQGGYKCFEAWNTRRAKLLWRNEEMTNYCQAAPAVTDSDVTFGAWDTHLYNLDRKTGTTRWKWNNGHSSHLFSPGNCIPAVVGNKVFIVAPDRAMTAIDRNTGKQLWRVKDYRVRESLGLSADKSKVYARTMDGELIAVSTAANDYDVVWMVDLGFGYEFSPCAIVECDGVVYAASRQGIVAAVDAESGELLWRKKCGISAVNGFEVDDSGNIYLSLFEGKIWRISKK
ncbi:MAG: PQQ-binding-like beta-propeller repeat protein [Alistipes sp.]|nr:PQQ-binding-like beta-propeller repeat protein [Alistipes sp.]